MSHKPLTAKQAAAHMTEAFKHLEQAHNRAMRVVRDRYPENQALRESLWRSHSVYRSLLLTAEEDADAGATNPRQDRDTGGATEDQR